MVKYLWVLMVMLGLTLSGCDLIPESDEQPETTEVIEEEQIETTEEVAEIVEEKLVITPIEDPGNLSYYRDLTGEILYIEVTGAVNGTIWGTDIYTDDSNLATATVHAGLLDPGETDIVVVTLLEGEESYSGSVFNGISSNDYGSWSGSYSVDLIYVDYELGVLPDPGNLTEYRAQTGDTFFFEVTGDTSGSIWGTDIYTDDSDLTVAAVHAGILEDGETGLVEVTICPGEESYEGSESNGILSMDYGSWSGSYIVK